MYLSTITQIMRTMECRLSGSGHNSISVIKLDAMVVTIFNQRLVNNFPALIPPRWIGIPPRAHGSGGLGKRSGHAKALKTDNATAREDLDQTRPPSAAR